MESNRSESILLVFQRLKAISHKYRLGDLALNLIVQFSSVAQSCLTLCNLMDCSTPGLLVHHQLPEFIQTHVH